MSELKVTLRKISNIWKHPNADKLELASLDGLSWQICIRKDSFKIDQEVFYFPIDAIIPDEISDKLGIKNYLAGKKKNRVKTVVLRGQWSQGMISSICSLFPTVSEFAKEIGKIRPSEINDYDWKDYFGITKYEPVGEAGPGELVPFPDCVSVYDIENSANYPKVFEELMDTKIVVTEKLEGTNYIIIVDREGKATVGQRSGMIRIEDQDEDLYEKNPRYRVARDRKYMERAIKAAVHNFPGQQVAFRGEMIGPGIQGNIYRLGKAEVRFFDIKVDHQYLPVATWKDMCINYDLPIVPILAEDVYLKNFLGDKTIEEISNGKSQLCNTRREGVVFRPMIEQSNLDSLGRIILKQRSPIYLSKSDS